MRKKTGNKLHTWEAALLLAVAAALLWGACTLQRQDALEQKVIRLHVIANSDSEADQALKLRVRDRVLVLAEDILRQSGDMEEARQRLAEALPRLQHARGFGSVCFCNTDYTSVIKDYRFREPDCTAGSAKRSGTGTMCRTSWGSRKHCKCRASDERGSDGNCW